MTNVETRMTNVQIRMTYRHRSQFFETVLIRPILPFCHSVLVIHSTF